MTKTVELTDSHIEKMIAHLEIEQKAIQTNISNLHRDFNDNNEMMQALRSAKSNNNGTAPLFTKNGNTIRDINEGTSLLDKSIIIIGNKGTGVTVNEIVDEMVMTNPNLDKDDLKQKVSAVLGKAHKHSKGGIDRIESKKSKILQYEYFLKA